MKKILAIAAHFDRCEAHLLSGLKKRGYSVEAVFDPEERFGDILRDGSVPLHPLRIRSRFDLGAMLAIRRLIKRGKFDIVHYFSNRGLSSGLLASIGLSVKSVAYRGTSGHLNRFDPLSRMTYLSKRLDRIICVSEAVRRYLLSIGISADKAVTIHKGHSPEWYRVITPVDRSSLEIPHDAFLVACVANMRPVKGVRYLLDSLEFIPEDSKIHLLLIGEQGEYHSPLPRVHFTGYRPDIPEILASCDAFVMPSIAREGLPKALIEAMIQSLPCIATSVGGMIEVIDDGIDGVIVPPKNSKALADAMLSFEKNTINAKKLGAAGLQKIIAKFSIEDTIRKTAAVYESFSASSISR